MYVFFVGNINIIYKLIILTLFTIIYTFFVSNIYIHLNLETFEKIILMNHKNHAPFF